MPFDMFMKTGDIKNESVDSKTISIDNAINDYGGHVDDETLALLTELSALGDLDALSRAEIEPADEAAGR